MKRRRQPAIWIYEAGIDVTALCLAYFLTWLFRFKIDAGISAFGELNRILHLEDTSAVAGEFREFYLSSAPRILLIMATVLLVIYALRDLYSGFRFIRRRFIGWQILVSNAIALASFYAYLYLTRNQYHPRSFFLATMCVNGLFTVGGRALLGYMLDQRRKSGRLPEVKVVLIGNTDEAGFIATLIREIRPHGMRVCATIPTVGKPFDAIIQEGEAVCSREEPDMVIAADDRFSIPELMQIIELGALVDASVKVLSSRLLVLVSHAQIPADMIHVHPLVHFEAPSYHARFGTVARLLSFAAASLLLVLTLLPMLVIALLIKGSTPGPVFFVQERIGVNRVPFRMFKFRTMYANAESMQARVEKLNESGGGLFKMKCDPRVTPVGRWLRRYSLDELPQLLNILRGEMTLVGPRPLPRRDYKNYYEEWHYSRHAGMPGVTCLWQVSGRSDMGFENMCILDVYYLSNHTWILDLQILLRTIRVVLFAKGAY